MSFLEIFEFTGEGLFNWRDTVVFIFNLFTELNAAGLKSEGMF